MLRSDSWFLQNLPILDIEALYLANLNEIDLIIDFPFDFFYWSIFCELDDFLVCLSAEVLEQSAFPLHKFTNLFYFHNFSLFSYKIVDHFLSSLLNTIFQPCKGLCLCGGIWFLYGAYFSVLSEIWYNTLINFWKIDKKGLKMSYYWIARGAGTRSRLEVIERPASVVKVGRKCYWRGF